MRETTFENAKVKDRVWSVEFGWGTVDSVHPYIEVIFQNNQMYRFNSDGSRFFTLKVNQTLFWDEIKIVPPERPKRKVLREIERWAIGFAKGDATVTPTWSCKDEAEYEARRIPGSFLIKLTGTYEVEE